MTDQQTASRADRAEETAERRRRRVNDVSGDPVAKRYGVGSDFFEHDKFVYYQAVDEGIRLKQLTEDDDYDFVTAKGDKAGKSEAAGVLRYQSGQVDGRPQYTYLLRKLKKFADEDRAVKARNVKTSETERLTTTPADAPEQSYTPKR